MDRREMLKLFPGIALVGTLTVDGKKAAAAAHIKRGHYILFCDCQVVDIEAIAEVPPPEGVTMDLVALKLKKGQTIDDAVRIYSLQEEGKSSNATG